MGYRLEVSKVVYTGCCGGKLYGYIDDETLRQCKSWQWLKRKGFIDEFDEFDWDYGFEHRFVLSNNEFKEFIKLYINDKKKFGLHYQQALGESLEDYKDVLKILKNKGEFSERTWCISNNLIKEEE